MRPVVDASPIAWSERIERGRGWGMWDNLTEAQRVALYKLADTARLGCGPLDEQACAELTELGLARCVQGGFWTITARGKAALSSVQR